MKTTKILFSILIISLMFANTVWAQEESPRETCAANAKAEGVPPEELDDYIQSCIESMTSEADSQGSSDGTSAEQ